MIDITKKYRTRNGMDVTELRYVDGDAYPFYGYGGRYWMPWTATGAFYEGDQSVFDLIEVTDADTEPA